MSKQKVKKARSPLRYPGGKAKALKRILPHVPDNIRCIAEPFAGGASVTIALLQSENHDIQDAWINDLNRDLSLFWWAVRLFPTTLIREVRHIQATEKDGRALYNRLKSLPENSSPIDIAVRFFVMNRITFSGVMDSGGYSNASFNKRFTVSSIDRLEAVAPIIRRAHVSGEDYTEFLPKIAEGDDSFAFIDPPYVSTEKSRLYGKSGSLHTGFDHETLANMLREANYKWLLTYDDNERVRDMFSFANIVEWEHQYGMNNYKQKNAAKGQELIIKNY